MIKINENYLKLQGNYLFSEITARVKQYTLANPLKKVIRLGIGDVTRPLTPSVVNMMNNAVSDMGDIKSFHGYGPEQGYDFLRKKINENDFRSRGIELDDDEIFISTGAKEDTGNFQELFSPDTIVALPDPVYPVYLDSNIMAGRAGEFNNGRYENICYLECTEENNFVPELPKEKVDLIYLCFPNNPTGQVLTKEDLKKWVDHARENKAIILFDAAYEAFITDKNIPHSIYEIEGAKECAIEFRSLSKTAGFTGTRCAYTIVPKTVMAEDDKGNKHSLFGLWSRRQTTKFNGVAYVIQKAAYQVFTPQGQEEVKGLIDYYRENAKIIMNGISSLGLKCSGGINSPYIWFKTPKDISSWAFFSKLLEQCQVVGTPGVGFGKCGEGYFRLTGFGDREDVKEAIARISKLKF
jgi:LL-diaminopimelate aminotransferase